MSLWENEKNKSLGVGPAATEASLTRVRRLKGCRYVVNGAPSAAIDLAIGPLVAEGFVLRVDDLQEALHREGSSWTGRTLAIGDVATSKRLWWQNFIFGDKGRGCTFLWQWAMRRGIAPTLVAVVARPLDDSRTELVISAVQSGLGPIEDAHAAEPRLTRALAVVTTGLAQAGRLLQQPEEFEPVTMDRECPAQGDNIKSLISWPQTER